MCNGTTKCDAIDLFVGEIRLRIPLTNRRTALSLMEEHVLNQQVKVKSCTIVGLLFFEDAKSVRCRLNCLARDTLAKAGIDELMRLYNNATSVFRQYYVELNRLKSLCAQCTEHALNYRLVNKERVNDLFVTGDTSEEIDILLSNIRSEMDHLSCL